MQKIVSCGILCECNVRSYDNLGFPIATMRGVAIRIFELGL